MIPKEQPYNFRPRKANKYAAEEIRESVQGFVRAYRFGVADTSVDMYGYLKLIKPELIEALRLDLLSNPSIKTQLVLEVRMTNSKTPPEYQTRVLRSMTSVLTKRNATQTRKQNTQWVKTVSVQLEQELQISEGEGSGWSFYRVDHGFLNLNNWVPISGAGTIPLPKWIENKQCARFIDMVGIHAKKWTDRCFELAMTSSQHVPSSNPGRLNQYNQYLDEWKMERISHPFKICVIESFERQNDVHVNVYGLDNKNETVIPLHVSSYVEGDNRSPIHILYYEEEEEDVKVVYCLGV